MKLVIDMNLSPRWCAYLGSSGHDAVHWSHVGDAGASDSTILRWAGAQDRIVVTHDLDFGAILAATGLSGPSVLQVKAADTSPEAIGPDVVDVIDQMADVLATGVLATVEPGKARITYLPLRRTKSG